MYAPTLMSYLTSGHTTLKINVPKTSPLQQKIVRETQFVLFISLRVILFVEVARDHTLVYITAVLLQCSTVCGFRTELIQMSQLGSSAFKAYSAVSRTQMSIDNMDDETSSIQVDSNLVRIFHTSWIMLIRHLFLPYLFLNNLVIHIAR